MLSGSASDSAFGYTGHYVHQATGLALAPYRAYDAHIGRWLSRDPIGEAGGVNLYTYVDGNPVNYTDSSGLIIDTLADIGLIAYDLYKLATGSACERNSNLTALGLDFAGAIIPGVTGLGSASRVARGSEEGAWRLAGANRAMIDPRKLTEYALNLDHSVGGNKAKVFESALGFNRSNADDLTRQLQKGVMNNTPIAGKVDQFGARYTVDIPVTGPAGSGTVRTGWIYKTGSDTPELTTLYVK